MKFKFELKEVDDNFVEFIPINNEKNFTILKQELSGILSEQQMLRYEFEDQRVFSMYAEALEGIVYKEY